MDNMELYKQFQRTPKESQKTIQAGRLKGFTDINPMWRIKRLTEVFGACGIGWWYDITDKRIEEGANGEKRAFVEIDLFYKWNGETSKAVKGMGGSSFVSQERSGLYTNDECFKMALTDAIGTACKSLGMSADIFFEKDRTKYTAVNNEPPKIEKISAENVSRQNLKQYMAQKGVTENGVKKEYGCSSAELSDMAFFDFVGRLKIMPDAIGG